MASADELAIQEISISHSQSIINSSVQKSTNYNTCTVEQVKAPSSQNQCCYRQKGSFYEHVVYFCCLSVASYVGVVARIYLTELANWDSVPFFPSLYPQMVGTMIMGFTASHKLVLMYSNNSFLYQAIATGLCGTITSFSTWNSEAASSLLQTGQVPPDTVARVLGWGTTLLLGLGMSTGALTVGCHLAMLSPWANSKQLDKSPEVTDKCQTHLKGCVFIFTWLVSTILIIVVPYLVGRRDLIFSILFAALGTYCRWHLSPLNSAFQHFKLGTFLVNVGGSWLLGGVLSTQRFIDEGALLQQVLIGLAIGFCGCITTVSTFAVELSSLSLRSSYLYAFTSILLAQIGIVLIRGTVQWIKD